jgi:hypothetical protein
MTHTITYGDIRVTLRRATNGDALARLKIQGWLEQSDPDLITEAHRAVYREFANIVASIEAAEGLPFSHIAARGTPEGAWEAYQLWLTMPEDFSDTVYAGLVALRRPATPATAPDPLPEDAKKKT